MKYIIRIMIPDCICANDVRKHTNDLLTFCRIARIHKPVLQNLPTADSFAIDLQGLPERKQLLWLHILSDLAALNKHFVVELCSIPDEWPLQEVY